MGVLHHAEALSAVAETFDHYSAGGATEDHSTAPSSGGGQARRCVPSGSRRNFVHVATSLAQTALAHCPSSAFAASSHLRTSKQTRRSYLEPM